MKKTYIKPITEVYNIAVADGILQVTSATFGGKMHFDLYDEGEGEDFARENNWRQDNSNAWDQGW